MLIKKERLFADGDDRKVTDKHRMGPATVPKDKGLCVSGRERFSGEEARGCVSG